MDGLTFILAERSCLHNDKLRMRGVSRGLICDCLVYLNGEHIATFLKVKGGLYSLADRTGQPLSYQEDGVRKADFAAVIAANLDRIPTQQQIAEREQRDKEAVEAKAAWEAQQRREAKIQMHSHAMFQLIKEYRRLIGPKAEAIIKQVNR